MLTVLIDSFDGYSDLWPTFFAAFSKHWPTCPYPVRLVLSANEKEVEK